MFFEDLDYCRILKQAGLPIYYLLTVSIIHHHGASGKNLATKSDQWKRLIPSSILYQGLLKHYLIQAVLWSGQKLRK